MVVNNIRDDKYLQAFGKHVKKLRNRKKLSRENLAVYSNIETMQVYRVETGQANATISTIVALAKGLEVHPKKLLDFNYE